MNRTKIFLWLWGVAEEADWDEWFPRRMWSAILRWCDRQAGYKHDADGNIINPHIGGEP